MRPALFLLLLILSFQAEAAGKKRPPPPPPEPAPLYPGVKGLKIRPIEDTLIRLPDGRIHHFGDEFRARLTTQLTESEQALVIDETAMNDTPPSLKLNSKNDDWTWANSITPSAVLEISLPAMTFVTGEKGNRLQFGFDEHLNNSYNNPETGGKNELSRQYFAKRFQRRGRGIQNTQMGLDLGAGFQLDVLFAFLQIQYEKFRSSIQFHLRFNAPLAGKTIEHKITVRGKGYFYDIVAGYESYGLALQIARRDAMLQAFRRGVDAIQKSISEELQDLPVVGRIDQITQEGTTPTFLLGVPKSHRLPNGTLFQVLQLPQTYLRVIRNCSSGSIAVMEMGNPQDAQISMTVSQVQEIPLVNNPTTAPLGIRLANSTLQGPIKQTSLELPSERLPKADFEDAKVPQVNRLKAFFRSLKEIGSLPYRIWRYRQYDQDLQLLSPKKIRSKRTITPDKCPVVAVIDSGVDYNHPSIQPYIWFNPQPGRDSLGRFDTLGWDFISGDERPFDDSYHGTEVASALLSLNPNVRIMPLKVFNPFGVTSSAAVHGAFKYAVEHQADIILIPWSSRRNSEAIRSGVALAGQHHIPVVVAAGDDSQDLNLKSAYPASLSNEFKHVLTVASLDRRQNLSHFSNYSSETVSIAALGEDLLVSNPRKKKRKSSGTHLAAARTAARLAELQSIDLLLQNSRYDPELESQIQGGRVLN